METVQPDPIAADGAEPVPLPRVLAGEVAVSTVVNIAFNLFFAWMVFSGVALIGRDAILVDVLPATFIPALLMTFPVTFLMRARIRKGLTVIPEPRLPVTLPDKLLVRAPAIALIALLLVGLPAVLLLWAFWNGDWNWRTLLVFKLAFSLFHASIVTPVVVLAALRENGPFHGLGSPREA